VCRKNVEEQVLAVRRGGVLAGQPLDLAVLAAVGEVLVSAEEVDPRS
jgi:hypothetical protein